MFNSPSRKNPKQTHRLQALKNILKKGELNSQAELRSQLEKMGYSVNQTTVSRDLRRLGAVKVFDEHHFPRYRLNLKEKTSSSQPIIQSTLQSLVNEIKSNSLLIVIKTQPGSAPLVAREIDYQNHQRILGTIAGDDTVFIALYSEKDRRKTLLWVKEFLNTH